MKAVCIFWRYFVWKECLKSKFYSVNLSDLGRFCGKNNAIFNFSDGGRAAVLYCFGGGLIYISRRVSGFCAICFNLLTNLCIYDIISVR